MGNVFGKKMTLAEQIRAHKRVLTRAERDLDREKTKLQNNEKKLILEIKKLAKQGQLDAAKVLARDLVRTRQYVGKFIKMRASLQAVGMRLQMCQSTQALNQAMSGVTKAMLSLNKQLNLPEMQKTMMEFAKQNEMMDMKEEMMGDAIDGVMDDGAESAETDAIISQVMDEIGINLHEQLAEAPGKQPVAAPAAAQHAPAAAAAAGVGGVEYDDSDLKARLDNLKKGP